MLKLTLLAISKTGRSLNRKVMIEMLCFKLVPNLFLLPFLTYFGSHLTNTAANYAPTIGCQGLGLLPHWGLYKAFIKRCQYFLSAIVKASALCWSKATPYLLFSAPIGSRYYPPHCLFTTTLSNLDQVVQTCTWIMVSIAIIRCFWWRYQIILPRVQGTCIKEKTNWLSRHRFFPPHTFVVNCCHLGNIFASYLLCPNMVVSNDWNALFQVGPQSLLTSLFDPLWLTSDEYSSKQHIVLVARGWACLPIEGYSEAFIKSCQLFISAIVKASALCWSKATPYLHCSAPIGSRHYPAHCVLTTTLSNPGKVVQTCMWVMIKHCNSTLFLMKVSNYFTKGARDLHQEENKMAFQAQILSPTHLGSLLLLSWEYLCILPILSKHGSKLWLKSFVPRLKRFVPSLSEISSFFPFIPTLAYILPIQQQTTHLLLVARGWPCLPIEGYSEAFIKSCQLSLSAIVKASALCWSKATPYLHFFAPIGSRYYPPHCLFTTTLSNPGQVGQTCMWIKIYHCDSTLFFMKVSKLFTKGARDLHQEENKMALQAQILSPTHLCC